MAGRTATSADRSMLEGYERGYEAQWQRSRQEATIAIPADSITAKAFDSKGTARPIDSVGVVFDLERPVVEKLVERQQQILRRVCERDPELGRRLRPLPRDVIHGTVYLAGIWIPAEQKESVIRTNTARAGEIVRSIPEIGTVLGTENRLGPWVVTHMRPDTEDDLGRWKEMQAGMGHLEFFPIYFIHASLLVVLESVENENRKRILDEVLDEVRRESAQEKRLPVRIRELHVTYARDFDHFDAVSEPLRLLSAEAYASARDAGYQAIARELGVKVEETQAEAEYRDRLWALRGWFPDYFWPHIDAMMASVGAGGVDSRLLAGLMQARKLQTSIAGDAAVPVVQVYGRNAQPRVDTLQAIMRAVEACGLPLTIVHQATWPTESGLDLQLVFEHQDEVRMAEVAQKIAMIPDVPPARPAPDETEPLSLEIKLPRGLGRLGDILQALDKYDPRIGVAALLGHPHWENYDWLDLELVIPKGSKEKVIGLIRFWASYRYTDTPVFVVEKGKEVAGKG